MTKTNAKIPAANISFNSLMPNIDPINTNVPIKNSSFYLKDFFLKGNIGARIIAIIAGFIP